MVSRDWTRPGLLSWRGFRWDPTRQAWRGRGWWVTPEALATMPTSYFRRWLARLDGEEAA
jgi:hypothetical protein